MYFLHLFNHFNYKNWAWATVFLMMLTCRMAQSFMLTVSLCDHRVKDQKYVMCCYLKFKWIFKWSFLRNYYQQLKTITNFSVTTDSKNWLKLLKCNISNRNIWEFTFKNPIFFICPYSLLFFLGRMAPKVSFKYQLKKNIILRFK